VLKEMIGKIVSGEDLQFQEARQVMLQVMNGEATGAQIGSLLTALRMKGETVEEISGCAQAMREKSLSFSCRHSLLVDTCGTGGDCSGTFNVSTTAAFVVAGAGVPVAKHGNRSVSSKSGSADLLEALGVKLDLLPGEVMSILDRIGIGFLYAPVFHVAMKHASGPRKEIGIRSIFNILGPLTNPARANVQVLGVYEPGLTEVMARVLERLGVKSAYVVHGDGGLDEISNTGPTKVSCLNNGSIKTFYIHPEELGFTRATLRQLQGGDARENAGITRRVLSGEKGPHRDIVLLNAAAALAASGVVRDLPEGVRAAGESIDSGKALEKLEQLVAATGGTGSAAPLPC
jgi:anthranilate phosphoribosyltransferase